MFKYLSFSNYSITNLINNEIYLNHYSFFNDPFECRCKVFEGFPDKNPRCERYQEIVKAWGFSDPHDKGAFDDYDDYAYSLKGTEPSVELILEKARVSCFSEELDNLLMWSHYGDGLRGFCIEFDPSVFIEDNSDQGQIYNVLYQEKPAIIDTALIAVLNDQVDFHGDAIYSLEREEKYLGRDHRHEISAYQQVISDSLMQNREIYQKMLATNPLEWQYEREIRLIAECDKTDKSGSFFRYSPESIKSLIIGEKMPLRQREVLKRILQMLPSSIELKTASREDGGYRIQVHHET